MPVPGGGNKTWAVIAGISAYQNKEIDPLQFAHADAKAFSDYLISPAGGAVPEGQIQLLLNENATTARFDAALNWLIEKAAEGDQVYIYFSGHGDVENRTMAQHGFLLTWDSPARSYVLGAYPLFYLQSVISTLSLQNKARVIMVADACRAGKLAGSAIQGAQITATSLQTPYANEIKILACGTNEFSVEGAQWGGGRGAFSYHLIDGLMGLADRDGNYEVSLREIRRYLEDRVPDDPAFALAAAYALCNRDELSDQAIESAVHASRSGDRDLVPIATKLLGRGRESTPMVRQRIRELISDEDPLIAFSAMLSAQAVGISLTGHRRRISKLLDQFAGNSLALLEVVGQQGREFASLESQVCELLVRAIRTSDDEFASALIECLRRIVEEPRRAIEKRIQSKVIREEALQRFDAAV